MTTDPHAGAELTDDALQGEIELVGDLVVAASGSEGPLTDEEIDAALGIERSRSGASDDTDDTGRSSPAGTGEGGSGADDVGGHAGGHGSPRHLHV